MAPFLATSQSYPSVEGHQYLDALRDAWRLIHQEELPQDPKRMKAVATADNNKHCFSLPDIKHPSSDSPFRACRKTRIRSAVG